MISKKSIRRNFLIQLIFASASLILIFSSLLYFYIERSIYDDKFIELTQYAKNIVNNKSVYQTNEEMISANVFALNIEVVYLKTKNIQTEVYEKTEYKHTYLTIIYPYKLADNSYLKITRDITQTKRLLKKYLDIFLL